MKKHLISLLISFCAASLFAQTQTTKVSVYFKSNKHELTAESISNLDSLLIFLEDKEMQRIVIQGNTDSDADSLYNIKLSEKRVLAVRKYLEEKTIASSLFSTAFNGENLPIDKNDKENGKQRNRRVDVIMTYKEKFATEESKPEPIKIVRKDSVSAIIDTCATDTTIVLPQGTRYVINRCDYRKYKDCIKVKEYLTADSILDSDLLTETSDNRQLGTGGMLDIKICDSAKLRKPLIFRIAVYNIELENTDCEGKVRNSKMTLWKMDKNNRWYGSEKLKMVKFGDTLFYEFSTKISTRVNIDYIKYQSANAHKITFKAKGNVKLVKVRLFYERSIYQSTAQSRKKSVQIKKISCPQSGCENCLIKVKAIAINAQGDTLVSSKCIDEYKGRRIFGGCKAKSKNIFERLFSFKKIIYPIYVIRMRDWKNK